MLKTLIAIFLSSVILWSTSHAEEVLVLNTSFAAPLVGPNHQGALDILYRSIGKQLGIDIQIQLIPAERALLNANVGIEDGDACRIAGLEKLYPGLIQGQEEVFQIQLSGFTKSNDIKLNKINYLI
jgi:polar amino acid transport system substrate-binding protein